MHTLLLSQNDAKIRGSHPVLGREQELTFQFPGSPQRYQLKVHLIGSPAATAALGGAAGALGAAYLSSANRIQRTIVEFARAISQPPVTSDVVAFQIIFLFHQTSADTARAITKALITLPQDTQWKDLPVRQRVAIRVQRAWMLSCESATDQVNHDPGMQRYIRQSLDMRLAAATGLTTEKTPPPTNPPEYWLPFVYTFSTGDAFSGGLVVDPHRVSFRKLPYEANPAGGFRHIPKPAGDPRSDAEYEMGEPTSGKVYKYEGSQLVEERILPANDFVNLMSDSF